MELDWSRLNTNTQNSLLKVGFKNAEDILLLSEEEVRRSTGLPFKEVVTVFCLANEMVIKSFRKTGYNKPQMLSSGCKNIDRVLGGGLLRGHGITEIAGESGVGKTQFCLQLSLKVQNSSTCGGFGKGTAYICTEDSFPSKRLHQLIQASNSEGIQYGDQIYIEHVLDHESLKVCLNTKVQRLLDCNKIGLLIIDSIAAIFRADFNYDEWLQRTIQLRTIAKKLQIFAATYNICVVCINQMTVSFDENQRGKSVPALGLAWASAVTNRIIMKKTFDCNIRQFYVEFSPYLPEATCNFTISPSGITDV